MMAFVEDLSMSLASYRTNRQYSFFSIFPPKMCIY